MRSLGICLAALTTGMLLMAQVCWAMTPAQLKSLLEDGRKVTVIDIRSTAVYSQGHIQGAINIPASIIQKKRLPPIGKVVVCGDGLNAEAARNAADGLNERSGIQADVLEGGFPAWQAFNLPATEQKGFDGQNIRYLTYQELEKALSDNPDILLVDLRSAPVPAAGSGAAELTDLFPGQQRLRLQRKRHASANEWDVTSILRRHKNGAHRQFFVFIDSGDGESEKVVQRLQAAGVKEVAILTGGEQTLQRAGKAENKQVEASTPKP